MMQIKLNFNSFIIMACLSHLGNVPAVVFVPSQVVNANPSDSQVYRRRTIPVYYLLRPMLRMQPCLAYTSL